MRTDDLDFHLPPDLIAQSPAPERSASRLLHYRRADRAMHHRTFADLPQLLRPGDLLVFNDTRVVPARFALRKPGGALQPHNRPVVELLDGARPEGGRANVVPGRARKGRPDREKNTCERQRTVWSTTRAGSAAPPARTCISFCR